MKPIASGVLIFCASSGLLCGADWPQYRGDAARSGYTAESLPAKLSRQWVYKARHAPRPAWSGRDTRMPFDRAYHTVIAGGRLYFGSSADCKVYALDAATGRERWTFFTGGPVRFAPALWKERVFVVSDDGCLYCLSAEDGKMLWRKRGGPKEDMLLGNDRMISRWPARGGPVVADGAVYFGAGIWPSEGIYVYALDAATGKVRWVNDSSGGLVMEQPHGGNRARSGISAQGYLAAAGDRLLVPSGRGVPAALDRANGELLYFHLAANGKSGGSGTVVCEGLFFNGGRAFDMRTGGSAQWIQRQRPHLTVASPGGVVRWDRRKLEGFKSARAERRDKKGKAVQARMLQQIWSIPSLYGGTSLVMAGRTLVSGGRGPGGHGVNIADVASKESVWSAKVDGDPLGLAVADGRLYVSTDKGTIFCYGPGGKGAGGVIEARTDDSPYGGNRPYARAADEFVKTSGVTEGYCLDLGCGDGALAYELAKRTKLHVCAVDPDPKKVALARRRLDAAGLYGVRVTVHRADPARTPYPNYFANLVVSGRSVAAGSSAVDHREALRLLRPCGGVSLIGGPGAVKKTLRGPLEGAGEWTHQYADAANTICSADRLAKGPLKMLWFTDFGFQMPSRHGRGHAPLFKDGILVIEGMDGLLAVDAYNGRRLWEFPVKDILKPYDQEHLLGTAFTNSNMCLAGESVFLRAGARVLRIELATGKKTREYSLPQQGGVWGYIACADGTLYGSRADEKHIVRYLFGRSDMSSLFTESDMLFALDVETGAQKWSYRAKHSIRHNAVAVGGGRVYLIDRPLEKQDRIEFAKKRVKRGEGGGASPAAGVLLCLDAATGRVLWRTDDEDIYGTMLTLSTRHNVLVMGYTYSQRSFQLPSERGDRLTGFRASDGEALWGAKDRYISRPLINGRTVYAQPLAWDLLTGKRKGDFRLTGRGPGGCGTISGSVNLLLYRSGTLGYTDLLRRAGTENYGGLRPGCWINAIPAGGLVLMPDATDRCTCSYLIKASIALQAMKR